MKRNRLFTWLAVIAVAALSSAATQWVVRGRPAAAPDRCLEGAFLARELGLSADQARAVGQLEQAKDAQLAACCSRHCAARAQLGPLLAGTNAAAAQAALKAMSQAYAESERVTWDHIQRVRALLTPAQQARYDALVARSVCGACNMDQAPAAKM